MQVVLDRLGGRALLSTGDNFMVKVSRVAMSLERLRQKNTATDNWCGVQKGSTVFDSECRRQAVTTPQPKTLVTFLNT